MGAAQPEWTPRTLQAYVPRLAVEWLYDEPDRQHLELDGSLAFVDISGFTQLTERLARAGRSGPEELSDILDSTFGALVETARADGADLVKWAGDAVLLLFRDQDHAARAARAASRMRRVLRRVGRTKASVGRVNLRMSVGIHSGQFHFFLVGDPAIHRELIVSGPGASVTATMEALADAGQVGLSDATARLLPRKALGGYVEGGCLLRSTPDLPDLLVPDPDDDGLDVRSLLPPEVRTHLLAAAGESEHRQVAVGFVQFRDTDALIRDETSTAAVAAIDEVVRNVQEACASHGVSFLESDINRDGGKIMLAAGAPRSSGDDDDRLLRALQMIVSRQGRLPLRAGANHGRVFAGDFGPEFRRTYSIKGDAINVAARVMAHAEWGTVLATHLVLTHSNTAFTTRQVEPFMVKGKSRPIQAAELGAPEAGATTGATTSPALPSDSFVGREHELATLQDAVDRSRDHRGSLVEVIGEPGMGKSRLLEEFLTRTGDLVVFDAPSSSYESRTAYHPIRTLLRDVLGVKRTDDTTVVDARLRSLVLDKAPHLLPWLPLLGIVLDIGIPPTQETEELDERFRRTKLEEVVVDFLGAVLQNPTLMVFENTHLMDDSSADLMRGLEVGLDERPWLVLVTRREMVTGYSASEDAAHVHRLPLAPIVGAQAWDLLDAETRSAPLSEHTMKAIAEKSGGNPLFIKALVTAALRLDNEEELPDSVEAVLASEIDLLEPHDRTLLRCAAVLGVLFSEDMLREMLVATGNAAAYSDLAVLDGFVHPQGDGTWRFRHVLLRDAAYSGLPYRLRRRLHAHAGELLESRSPRLEDVSERLSMHFFAAGDADRAWTYSRMAGRRAQRQYDYTAAIEFYRRAVESGRSSSVGDADLAEVLEAMGDVDDIAGFSSEAVEAFRSARRHRNDDPLGRATLLLKEAGLHQRLGAFTMALRVLTQGRSLLVGVEGTGVKATRSRLATSYAFSKYLQGDHKTALSWSAVGLQEARDADDQEALAKAYNVRHIACLHAGVPEEEPYGELALAAFRDLGDLPMHALCLNNLAIGAMHDGHWARSAELLDEAAGIFRRIGDTADEANALYNRADLLIRQHRFAEAEPLLASAFRAALAAGDRELVALATRETGQVLAGLGRPNEALEQLETARLGFTALGLAQELVILDGIVAECQLALGDHEDAIATAADALVRARKQHLDSELASLQRVQGLALSATGRPEEARAAFDAALDNPGDSDGGRGYALTLLGIAGLVESGDPAEAARLRDEAWNVLDGLGVARPSA